MSQIEIARELQVSDSSISSDVQYLREQAKGGKFDTSQACRTAHKFFGKNNVNFVAIDGTEYSKPMFDMVIFYAGAYSCEGSMTKDYSVIIYIIINFTLSKVKATAFESLH